MGAKPKKRTLPDEAYDLHRYWKVELRELMLQVLKGANPLAIVDCCGESQS